ncbi:hypothetical protein, partial [Aliivibrio fischeri]
VICKGGYGINYNDFKNKLERLGFNYFYLNSVSNRNFRINYNDQLTTEFNSIHDAGCKYNYIGESEYQVSIDLPINILDAKSLADDKDLLITCIEIFDWGDVQKSNILSALKLHRKGDLRCYLNKAKKWFEDDNNLSEPNFKVIWSSGWTKVYSFMFQYTTIYDSRVAAFINQVLLDFCNTLTDKEKLELQIISKGLLTFGGNVKNSDGKIRIRVMEKPAVDLLQLYKSPNEKRKMLANKKASWFIRYMAELDTVDFNQKEFRNLDKAAFMLGFDLSQW